jgi:hypothetical protein
MEMVVNPNRLVAKLADTNLFDQVEKDSILQQGVITILIFGNVGFES